MNKFIGLVLKFLFLFVVCGHAEMAVAQALDTNPGTNPVCTGTELSNCNSYNKACPSDCYCTLNEQLGIPSSTKCNFYPEYQYCSSIGCYGTGYCPYSGSVNQCTTTPTSTAAGVSHPDPCSQIGTVTCNDNDCGPCATSGVCPSASCAKCPSHQCFMPGNGFTSLGSTLSASPPIVLGSQISGALSSNTTISASNLTSGTLPTGVSIPQADVNNGASCNTSASFVVAINQGLATAEAISCGGGSPISVSTVSATTFTSPTPLNLCAGTYNVTETFDVTGGSTCNVTCGSSNAQCAAYVYEPGVGTSGDAQTSSIVCTPPGKAGSYTYSTLFYTNGTSSTPNLPALFFEPAGANSFEVTDCTVTITNQ